MTDHRHNADDVDGARHLPHSGGPRRAVEGGVRPRRTATIAIVAALAVVLGLVAWWAVSPNRWGAPHPRADLLGPWRTESVWGVAVKPETASGLRFEAGTRVVGQDPCGNRMVLTYEGEGNQLTFPPGGTTTWIACDDYEAFHRAINDTTSYRIDGGKLVLLERSGDVAMTLTRADGSWLAGGTSPSPASTNTP